MFFRSPVEIKQEKENVNYFNNYKDNIYTLKSWSTQITFRASIIRVCLGYQYITSNISSINIYKWSYSACNLSHTHIYIYAAHDGVMIPETLIVDRLIELQYP